MNVALRAACWGLGILCISATASAAEPLPQRYFAVNGYFVDPDDERGTDREGAGADFLYGWEVASDWFLEARLFGSVLETGSGAGSDFFNSGVGVDLHYLLGERGEFSAFVLLGGGFAYNDVRPNELDEGVAMANAGIGLLSRALTETGVRLRIEGRTIYEDFLDGVTDYRVGLGLEIPVGRAEIVVREVPVAAPPEERAPAPEGYPPRPVDSDNDGVLDHFDRCPGTLAGARVDRSGCVVETEQQTVTLEGVHFELDSDRLTPNSKAILDRAVEALRGQPDLQVEIAGHTDSIGDAEYNLRLSLARAVTVRRYLTSNGIARSRLSVAGYGEEQPIASNDTPEGRAKNRRVEFRLGATGEAVAVPLNEPIPRRPAARPASEPASEPDFSDIPEK